MQIEGFRSGRNFAATDVNHVQSELLEKYKEEIRSLQMEIVSLRARTTNAPESLVSVSSDGDSILVSEKIVEIHEDRTAIPNPVDTVSTFADGEDSQSLLAQSSDDIKDKSEQLSQGLLVNPCNDNSSENSESVSKLNREPPSDNRRPPDNPNVEAASENTASSLISLRCQGLRRRTGEELSYLDF